MTLFLILQFQIQNLEKMPSNLAQLGWGLLSIGHKAQQSKLCVLYLRKNMDPSIDVFQNIKLQLYKN